MEVAGKVWTEEPWLPYQATRFIDRCCKLERVFEYGMGGSTLFFYNHLHNIELVSVDHDPTWYLAVLEKLGANCQVATTFQSFILPPVPGDIGPDKANPDHYKSGSTELGPCNFREYASAIDRLGLFDLILVDGMARASCLKHAVSHVKPGGVLVLDNTDDNRSYYLQNTLAYFTDWERIDFFGYGPILDYPWRCTAFVNNRKASYEQG